MGCRCFWDSDTDNYAQDIYMSVSCWLFTLFKTFSLIPTCTSLIFPSRVPWQIIWCGIPAAYLPLYEIIKAKNFNFGKIAEYWNDSKFRITGLNIGKMWPMAGFSQKAQVAAFLRESHNKLLPMCILQKKKCCFFISFKFFTKVDGLLKHLGQAH